MQQNMTKEAYMREYQAEFTEAATSYFQQELIRRCIEHAQQLGLEPYTTIEQQIPKAEYYAGLDLGKLQDHSALAIIQKDQETLKLIYHHQFPLQMPYTEVINTLQRVNEKFRLQKLLADQTGIGEPVLDAMQEQGITCAEGAKLTQDAKTELLTHLKLTIQQAALPTNQRPAVRLHKKRQTHLQSPTQRTRRLTLGTCTRSLRSKNRKHTQTLGSSKNKQKPIQASQAKTKTTLT
jgi:phage terminase large subunit-like protein